MRSPFRISAGVSVLLLAGLSASAARPTAPPSAKPGPAKAPAPAASHPAAGPLDFDRDVRPILSENCFACHGFDAAKRQGGLRLDEASGAMQKTASGKAAVVPGKPGESELMRRVTAENALKMPPESSGKKLTRAQIETLRRWIAGGAAYSQHWAFVPPKRPALPPVKNPGWASNPIDRFVLARLEREGLRPSPTADRYTLIRRLSFDLTGLPPTPAEVDAFVADRSPDAYEKVVDRFLASPHFGERMALKWLDLARYADTHGFHIDSAREMWPWREWVIRAYNQNLPYDQFLTQQLAGDLLPNATLDQKIATGFNRNHPINFEGGAIPEEYAAAYVFDRIDTTATTFMGLTLRCSQCHDHKYDPLTQKDFYRFYAFFNNVPENGLDGQKGNAAPFIKAPSAEQHAQLAELDQKVAGAEGAVKARAAEALAGMAAWERSMLASTGAMTAVNAGLVAHFGMEEKSGAEIRDLSGKQAAAQVRGAASWESGKFGGALKLDGSNYAELAQAPAFERTDRFSYGAWVYPTSNEAGTVLSRMDAAVRGWDLFLLEGRAYVHLIHQWDGNAVRVNTKNPVPLNEWRHVFVTYDGSGKAKGVRIYVDGKPAELQVTHDSLSDTIQTAGPLFIGRRNPGAPFKGMIDEVRIYDRELAAAEVEQLAGLELIRQILATEAEKRTPAQRDTLAKFYLENHDEPYRRLSGELADWKKKRSDLDASIPTTMVMQEMEKPRDTFLLVRGQYDKKGEKVTPGVPEVLPPLPKDLPANRLALARWLTDPSHPLTARVAVNRFWELVFGQGLVRTSENFGTQGERPSHPELLDWLAASFSTPAASSGADGAKEGGREGEREPRGDGETQGRRGEAGIRPSVSPSSGLGWDQKALVRLLVTSNTYKQRSSVTPELLRKDPENVLLARGPRFRLPAEFVRDQALAAGGLLVDKLGGPSVRPYQPPGLWEELAFGGGFSAQKYEQDHGEALYRRSMYTFWKRTCPPPSLLTFDAPEREFCIVRRGTSNTPLQALVLMNDPTYVEASRKLAERLLTEATGTPNQRLDHAYRLVLSRPAKPSEINVLLPILYQRLEAFRKDPAAAEKLLNVGESKRNERLDKAELAAWTAVSGILLNLDETITKN